MGPRVVFSAMKPPTGVKFSAPGKRETGTRTAVLGLCQATLSPQPMQPTRHSMRHSKILSRYAVIYKCFLFAALSSSWSFMENCWPYILYSRWGRRLHQANYIRYYCARAGPGASREALAINVNFVSTLCRETRPCNLIEIAQRREP